MMLRRRSIVLASLTADALALGAHWIYDTRQIDEQIGRMDTLRDPLPTSFHTTKRRGEFTHYGDQTLLLLRSLSEAGRFSLVTFSRMWQAMFDDYTGYRDQATRVTLGRLAEGQAPEEAGSTSSDLGGAARIAPLVYRYQHDEESLMEAVRRQTAMTHRNTDVVDSAVYFAMVALLVMRDYTPSAAIEKVTHVAFDRSPFKEWVEMGLASRNESTREAIGRFGQACDVKAAFPGVIHLVAKYQDAPREGLIENVMAGGDSAARGLLTGMVFGAYAGTEAIAPEWLTVLKSRPLIEDHLEVLSKAME